MTRVSTRRSAAVAHADPMAIPTSTELTAHGTPSGLPAHVGYPQCPQFSPCACSRVPIIMTHSACNIFSASRRKNFIPCSSTIAIILSDNTFKLSSEIIAISIISTPLPFGAVRAAVIICLATFNTCSCRHVRSFCIITFTFTKIDSKDTYFGQ